MELEWKSIEKDGMPKILGKYIFANDFCYSSYYIKNTKETHAGIYTHWYGPLELPKKEPKYLTFIEALRVVLDGGIVRPAKGGYTFALKINFESFLELWDGIKWTIVEPAPKPKMPDSLKELNHFFDTEIYDLILRRPLSTIINAIDKKLKPLLEEYSK